MIPRVSTLDLLIAISSTLLSRKGAISFSCLKHLLTSISENKSSPVLNLAYFSLCKILQNLTIFLRSPLYSYHSIFPFFLQCHMLIENQ